MTFRSTLSPYQPPCRRWPPAANAAYDDNLNKDGSALENGEPWAGLPDATVAALSLQETITNLCPNLNLPLDMFTNSRVAITGGNFTHNNYGLSAFDKLKDASAPSALYDSRARFDPPKCHRNTRIAVLEYLIGWIFGRNDPEALILWLYGPAGAGKSAILQTIAERCAETNSLLASFFFGRSDPTRNHITPLIPTIACQMAITLPELKPYVEGAIERDPFLLDKSLATQFRLLIVTPLQALVSSGNLKPSSPRLIVIDGLDECDDPKMQSMIIRIIADAFRSQNLPVIFLIASRSESNIQYTFSSTTLSGLWQSVVLDYTYKPDDDIHLFLMDSFNEIKTTHPHRSLISTMWPRQSDIDTLIWKSSGQFIYASQAVKYISDPNDSPSRRLDIIMGLRPSRHNLPFSELDALYTHLLELCSDDVDIVISILGLVVIGIGTSIIIELFLDLEPGDIDLKLAPLASIVCINSNPYSLSGSDIFLLHASFGDFLTDQSRSSPNFYIDILAIKERALSRSLCCMKISNTPVWTDRDKECWNCLQYSLRQVWQNLPLTENVKDMLMGAPVLDICTSCCNSKGDVINFFLGILVCITTPYYDYNESHIMKSKNQYNNFVRPADEVETLESIYNFHKSSCEPIFRLEVVNYFKNTELMTLVILSASTLKFGFSHTLAFSAACLPTLLHLSPETRLMDNASLNLGSYTHNSELMQNHYKELVPAFNPSDYIPMALRILAFLCSKPPHPIQYYKLSRPFTSKSAIYKQPAKPRRFLRSVTNPHTYPSLTSYATYQMQRRSVPYPRFRRVEKHCHGIHLSFARHDWWGVDATRRAYSGPYGLGFLVLPEILGKCSKSEDLIAFIRTHGKKIAFSPGKTPDAIRAMHAYLDRVTQDVEMVDSEHPTL
ncbi:hypothetical protein BDN70DRAFT_937375 [Pholiota conissans]|uniref:Nephrocystin 3-like N-terminal domain-containing protein n=1 Tax=Pholiota conissans TaxID=109636 RepID=A0A9P6CU11_9AGAR|nr:hypothetical protein BDN70DRAFT_937375 [Pholiota conissans]